MSKHDKIQYKIQRERNFLDKPRHWPLPAMYGEPTPRQNFTAFDYLISSGK